MIFKQLFSPKHKSSDPEQRKASVDKLSKDNDKDKQILHELAFNDDDPEVSLAALNKLDSFALWMKSAETSKSARIKKHAQQACVAQLEDQSLVSDKLFLTFIKESQNKPLLEQLLFSSKRLQAQEELSMDILFSLNNVNHVRRFFQESASQSQQMTIIANTNDAKVLSRLSKYTTHDAVKECIENKEANIVILAEKPKKLKHKMMMINSRLLALKEAQDYEYMNAQLLLLTDEFESIKDDAACLDDLSQSTFQEKYLSLKGEVQRKLDILKDAYLAELAQAQASADISLIQEQCAHTQAQINILTNSLVSSAGQASKKDVEAGVAILTKTLTQTSTNLNALKESLHTNTQSQHVARLEIQIEQQQYQLTQVFSVVDYVQKAQVIIEALSASIKPYAKVNTQAMSAKGASSANHTTDNATSNLLPQDDLIRLKQAVSLQKVAFSQLKKDANALLPQDVISAFSQTLALANVITKQFDEQYKNIENKCSAKLNAVNRLISEGKFKSAMSIFHQAQKLFDKASEHAPIRLQKAFEETSNEVSKLQDWQAYIARPRKPALLQQAEALATGQFEDPYERSHSVKLLRQEWNSLGQLHTAEDEADNKAFDAFIEKAFVPCRAFFAELERQRELSYQKALGLIDEIKAISVELPAAELASKMGGIKAQFNKLGELERSQKSKVRRDFSKALKPLSAIIASEQQQCALQKRSLIEQAVKVAAQAKDEGELNEAVDKAKSLQQKWKLVGFAGKNTDNELWQAFRQVNDELFTRFHQNMNDKRNAQHFAFNAIDKEVSALGEKVKVAKSLAQLQFYENDYALLVDKAKAIDDASYKKLQPKLRKVDDTYSKHLQLLNKQRDTSATHHLFTFLHAYDSHDMPGEFDELLGRYKTWVKGDVPQIALLNALSRESLAQVAAILLNIPHVELPIGDEAERKNLQLKMMAAKFQGDSVLEPQSVLAAWVSKGPVTTNEQDSLRAMQMLFSR